MTNTINKKQLENTEQNNGTKLNCDLCDYTTNNKSNYNKHLKSIKHIKSIKNNSNNENLRKNDTKLLCDKCGKILHMNKVFRVINYIVVMAKIL